MKYQTAIVVGASSGMGRELVRQLAASGTKVAAIARREERLQELVNEFPGLVTPIVHDVTDYDAIPELFQTITRDLRGLDLFIYNSGAMPIVEANEFTWEKDKQMLDVNICGAVAWCNQAADRFLHTNHGYLVGIGSVAGDRGRHKQPVYNASKAFFHTYLEALRNRGVCVSTIKPGPVDTEMTAPLNMKGMMSASTAAKIILSKADKNGEHYLKLAHRIAFYIIKRIPSPLFRKLKI
jgi:decaprenylphospho-beta-D-erythro-pentofuranosid-2-ulose 2-reductase